MKYDVAGYNGYLVYKDKLCQNCVHRATVKENFEHRCGPCWASSLKGEGDRPSFKRPPIPLEELIDETV